jgi:hypothetical protein
MHQPPAWTPPSPEISELQALIRRLETLVQMRTMETNRLACWCLVWRGSRLPGGNSCVLVRADPADGKGDP